MKRTAIQAMLLTIALSVASNASAELVAYYAFEGNAYDGSGNNLNGTAHGGAAYVAGLYGHMLSLDGGEAFIDCGNDPIFDITDKISIAAWIRVEAFDKPYQAIVTKGDSAWRLQRLGSLDSIAFHCHGLSVGWGADGEREVDDGQWHFVVGTYDGGTISLYIDGEVDASVETSGAIWTNDYPVMIGANAETPEHNFRSWNGFIDEVRIYARALSVSEVEAMLADGLVEGDFNLDGRVASDDFAEFGATWMDGPCNLDNSWCGGCDLTYDGALDMRDFGVFTSNWLCASHFPESMYRRRFQKPYNGVVKKQGEVPLLVILLEADDPLTRSMVNVYGLGDDSYMMETILGIDETTCIPRGDRSSWDGGLPTTRTFTSPPTVFNWPTGNIQTVLALGEDKYIYQSHHDRYGSAAGWKNWSAWRALPKNRQLKSAPAVINLQDGSEAWAYALGQDGYIYRARFAYNYRVWGQWEPQFYDGRKFKSAPAVIIPPDTFEVWMFALGEDDYIYWSRYARIVGFWSPWEPVKSTRKFKSAPAVLDSPYGNCTYVYALGMDNYIHRIEYINWARYWTNWTAATTREFQSAPAVMNSADGHVRLVCALGHDGYYYGASYPTDDSLGFGRAAWHRFPSSPPESGRPARLISAPAVTPRLMDTKTRNYLRGSLFGPTFSLREYFKETSYRLFTFKEAYTTRWLKAEDDPGTPGQDESSFDFISRHPSQEEKSAYVISQVEKMIDPDDFRFADWDNNGDGLVTDDELAILWIYPGQSGRGRGTDPAVVKVDSLSQGVRIGLLMRAGSRAEICTLGHELGHNPLNLQDLYETKDGEYPGVGPFSLMGKTENISHLDPWSKIRLGWLWPRIVCRSGAQKLDAVETHPDALLIYNPNDLREFFIVENRWPDNSHEEALARIDRGGLAIWHIHEAYSGGLWGRKTVTLVGAQGPSNWGRALWDGNDPETGYDFTPNSEPSNSRWHDGSDSGISISNIPTAGPRATVRIEIR